jgi:hypothetical protein
MQDKFKYNTHIQFFYVHGSVHRESMFIIVQRDATMYSLLLYFCKLLYVFRVVTTGAHITVITVICAPDDG